DLIIVSPGVPRDVPILRQARARNIPVWSELELGFRMSQTTVAAITGSSGKSTTVSMLGAIVAASGRSHAVIGNIGVPVISVMPGLPLGGVAVVEVSSFQLEYTDAFRPRVAAVLNLMKNHLDRYADENEYYQAKKAIFKNAGKEDFAVLNANDMRLMAWAEELTARTGLIYFGKEVPGAPSVWADAAAIYWNVNGKTEKILDLDKMQLAGRHNYDNASAAIAMAWALGISPEACRRGLGDFKGLAHRLEYAGTVDGVRYYNDSKATTAESVAVALSAFGANVHLIAGGRDKGCDFSIIREAVSKYVKDICLIGEAADRMAVQLKDLCPIRRAATLAEAVTLARQAARPGDVVVFSPGCSSFDMFQNFEQRGDAFKTIVTNFKGPKL
ncbi:MAG: UDP-N-acetylmuramoyl-L-alanine--D-glutamate ligase, partial [Chitinivibrionales bacterium]|nr:UDP-N-acetylmuramoyl-L-alanine--D-glutamate ligase [Chitinivibrionales bacterium]